ncbi:hypothetical protein M0805_005543, partial [Coniferiporia weirii]
MSLKDALRTTFSRNSQDGYAIYKGHVSKNWCIGKIPHGGYAVGIILSAAGALQTSTSHPDIIHATVHFLQPLDADACEVRVKPIREGKHLTNVEADLMQNGKTRIAARLVYSVLPDISCASPKDHMTLAPPYPLARRIPLTRHPASVTPDKPSPKFLYQIKAEDPGSGLPGPLNDGLEWGAWLQLAHDEDTPLDPAMVPFLVDCMKNLPDLLPPERRPGPTWFATVVLTIEFKSRIPSFFPTQAGPPSFSPRTVGLYSSARFMSTGRHDEYVELWTAPSTIRTDSNTTTESGA